MTDQRPHSLKFQDWIDPHKQADLHAHAIIAAAAEVHRVLGPGYEKDVYREAMADELCLRGVPHRTNPVLEIRYKGRAIGEQQLDLLVGNEVLVDVMACEALRPIDTATMASHLRATQLFLGLLINFKVEELLFGIKRVRPTGVA
jgi:GxxExxY protein